MEAVKLPGIVIAGLLAFGFAAQQGQGGGQGAGRRGPGGQGGQNGQQRGGPPGVFISTTPEYDISAIECAPTPTSVTLSVMSTKDREVSLSIGGRFGSEQKTLKAFEPQSFDVKQLKPGTTYGYTLTYDGGEKRGEFKTPKTTSADFKFVIQADSHLDENSSADVYARTLNQMVADKPDFLVDLGDTFMTDKHKDFHDAIKQYRAQRYFFGIFGSTAPVYLALGNHDGEAGDERNKPGMTAWSMAQRKLHYPPPTTGSFYTGITETGDYFDIKWGDAQCFILDPFNFTKNKPGRDANNWNWTLGSAQYRWLKKSLETSKAKYKFVFIHHLVGGQGKDARGGAEASHFFEWGGKNWDGTDGFASNRPDWEAPLHELFKKHGVQVVFRGHDHLYVRQERDGIFYQLVPQPSQKRGDNTRSAEEYGYKTGTILGASGYLRVSVSAGEAKVEYVYTQGGAPQIKDSYTVQPLR